MKLRVLSTQVSLDFKWQLLDTMLVPLTGVVIRKALSICVLYLKLLQLVDLSLWEFNSSVLIISPYSLKSSLDPMLKSANEMFGEHSNSLASFGFESDSNQFRLQQPIFFIRV